MIDTPKPVRVSINKFKGWQGNPRNITAREMESLQASLKKNGFVTTVVARKAVKGVYELIGGHQRIDALHQLKKAGEKVPTHVWAIVLDVTDDEAHKLNVSLNRGGSFDDDMVADLLAGLGEITAEDALAMGFEQDEIADMLATTEPEVQNGTEDLTGFARSITLAIEFETIAERDAAKEWLKQAAAASETRPGKVLSTLISAEEVRMAEKAPKRRRRTRSSTATA